MRGVSKSIGIFLVLAMMLWVLPGCAGNKDVFSGKGTITFVKLESGFYGIMGDNGRNYDPINLSPEFEKDGLRVQFKVRIRQDVATTRMWGTPVEIVSIEICGG